MSAVTEAVRDPARLSALREAGLLDAPPEEAFDQLARVAASVLDAPVALVSLIDADRQFFLSCIGNLPEPWRSRRQTPLTHSFCQYQLVSREPLVLEDAREHPVLRDSLAIRDLGVVAYAGVPLVTPEGHVLGALCVLDSKPRTWGAEQLQTLRSLAAVAVSTISYRSAARTSARAAPPPRRSMADGVDPVSPPDGSGSEAVGAAADALASAVAEYLGRVDDYDRCVRDPEPTRQTLEREAEYRDGVLAAEAALRRAAQGFARCVEGTAPDRGGSAAADPAVGLWRACAAHLEAADRRAEANARFRRGEAPLAEAERRIELAQAAEQALRMALRNHETTKW